MALDPEVSRVPKFRPIKTDLSREDALRRARAGEPITGLELRAILRVSSATYHRHLAAGDYDALRVTPRIGPPRFAGLKVTRYIDGEGMRDTDRTFGRRKVS